MKILVGTFHSLFIVTKTFVNLSVILNQMFVAFLFVLQGEVMRTKNTDILPFPLIFMGTIVAFLWVLYGLIVSNVFIIVSSPNAFYSFEYPTFVLYCYIVH